jgi:hypothetical protein
MMDFDDDGKVSGDELPGRMHRRGELAPPPPPPAE